MTLNKVRPGNMLFSALYGIVKCERVILSEKSMQITATYTINNHTNTIVTDSTGRMADNQHPTLFLTLEDLLSYFSRMKK